MGKENYKYLKQDAKKGCNNCPFKFCVGSNCKAYKKMIRKDNDEISYIIKNKYKGGNMNYKIEGNKGKKVVKIIQFIIGFIVGIIITLAGLIVFAHIV